MASCLILKEFDESQGRLSDNLQAVRRDLVERVPFGMPVFSRAGWISIVESDEIGIDEVDRRNPCPHEWYMVIENRIGSVSKIVPKTRLPCRFKHLLPRQLPLPIGSTLCSSLATSCFHARSARAWKR